MLLMFKQIPLPNTQQFDHNHQCSKCKQWSRELTITYSDKIENTKFICLKCQPVKLIPAPLPTKTEFRKYHKCMECSRRLKTGVLTYCHRCEEAEFVCPRCLLKWFDNIEEGEDGHDSRPDPMR